jgi:hypothetical protein
MNTRIINTIGKLIPIFIFIGTIGGLFFSFGIGRIDWAIKGLYLAIPVIISCLVLYDFKGKNINLDELQHLISLNQRSSIFIFFILFFILITSILLFSDIVIIFNLGITILYIVILLQILSKSNISPGFLILEMISLIALFFYKIVISVPLYFGNGDILTHNSLDLITYLTHHTVPLISPYVESGYANFPLYHIFCAEGMEILNLNNEIISKILTWPITALLIIPIIYLFFREFINNQQILLFSIFSLSIFISGFDLSQYMIPRGFAFFGFFIMLYFLVKIKNQFKLSKRIALTVCIIPIMLFLILAHQVSILLINILILLLIICEYIVNNKKYFTDKYILFFAFLSLSYWIYLATEFIRTGEIIPRFLLGQNLLVQNLDLITMTSLKPIDSLSYFFINNIGSIITSFLLILGICYLLREREINYLTVLSLFCLFTILLYIRNPLQSVWQFSSLFAAERFIILLSPFMALMIGVGLAIFLQYLLKKFNNKIIIFCLFFGILIIYMVGTMGFVHDDMGYPEKIQFDLSDLFSFKFVTNNVPFNETIYSDFYYYRYFNQGYIKGIENIGIPYYSSNIISNPTSLIGYSGYTLIPNQQFYTVGLVLADWRLSFPRQFSYFPTKENIIELNMIVQNKNKIYSNKVIDMYYG